MLRGPIVAVFVNRNPIHRLSIFIGQVSVALVMLHVDAFIKDLAEADRDRLQDAEQAIQQRRTEIGIVNEVVGDAVDVPRDADGVDQTENDHHPERHAREKVKHPKKVDAMQKAGRDWDRVPARLGKQFGIGCDPFDDYGIRFHGEDSSLPRVKSVSGCGLASTSIVRLARKQWVLCAPAFGDDFRFRVRLHRRSRTPVARSIFRFFNSCAARSETFPSTHKASPLISLRLCAS